MPFTTIKKPSDYFNAKLWTGTESSNSITGVGFQPDMVWIKNRSTTHDHRLADAVRGVPNLLYPSTTDAAGDDGNAISSLDSDGFTVGSSTAVNGNGNNLVAWNWLGANGTASNTDGSITSTVSANTTSGFSIVSYTGTGANATVGHGLGVTPNIIISKRRSAIGDWLVGGSTVNTVGGGSNKLLLLNSTVAIDTNSEVYQTIGASTFQIGINAYINTNTSTMISYCFAEKQGFSKFGSYVGNGSTDGAFVYTGFKPAFTVLKRTDAIGGWIIVDNKRDTFNVAGKFLYAHDSGAEQDLISSHTPLDFLSNGMKMRSSNLTGTTSLNISGASYIYMAFAEEPLVGDNPATAR